MLRTIPYAYPISYHTHIAPAPICGLNPGPYCTGELDDENEGRAYTTTRELTKEKCCPKVGERAYVCLYCGNPL